MKIGFLTNALVEQAKRSGSEAFQTLDQVADWAADHGFTDLECGPMLPSDRAAYERVLAAGRIDITALIYCRNYLSTDAEEAANHLAELEKRIEFAGALGIDKVVTSTGIDKTIEEGIYDRDPNVKDRGNMIRRIPVRSLDRVVDLFGPLVELAEKNNVRLCFENCPLMGNIAISPVMWRRIFERLDSDRLGIAYDPSHLVWEMIDPYAPVDEFQGQNLPRPCQGRPHRPQTAGADRHPHRFQLVELPHPRPGRAGLEQAAGHAQSQRLRRHRQPGT